MEFFERHVARDIKWMTWNKAWEVANRKHGLEHDASADAARSRSHEESALRGIIFESYAERAVETNACQICESAGEGEAQAGRAEKRWRELLEQIRWMVHNASWHANNTRNGSAQDALGDRQRYEQNAVRVAESQVLSPRLVSHLKGMCWNAAWCAANERVQNLPDALRDKCMFRKHARLLHRHELKGVNIGGWLLLERWMCSGVFAGSKAKDEYDLSSSGPAAAEKIRAWRESFITEQDFKEIREHGFNCVRLPYGYWCVANTGIDPSPFVPGDGYLDQALTWAERHDLSVILDLHSAPGFQSGHQACGRANAEWRPHAWDIPKTLHVLKCAARAFKDRHCVTGMTVINEPSNWVEAATLVRFYLDAYAAIRAHMPAERVTVFLPVYTRSVDALRTLGLGSAGLRNVMVELHLYQCFGYGWQHQGVREQLRRAGSGAGHCPGIEEVLRAGLEVAVGEWSLKLPLWDARWPAAREWKGMRGPQRDATLRQFASNQLAQFRRRASGWSFWCWKVDARDPCWSAKECLERGWLRPAEF